VKKRVLENVGALEKGILILGCDIRVELAKMTPAEARDAKRKYRKLLRKVKKEYLETFGHKLTNKKVIRSRLRQKLRKVGFDKLEC
jgi:hypothetical protein